MQWKHLIWLSLAAILVLVLALIGLSSSQNTAPSEQITVYAAASLRLPLEALSKQFEKETGIKVAVDYGSSGDLETRLKLDIQAGKQRADVYIPADASFTARTAEADLTDKSTAIASFHLVVAHDGSLTQPQKLSELARGSLGFVICSPLAGAGAVTQRALEPLGLYTLVVDRAKAVLPTVTEAAYAIKQSNSIASGIVWSSTAKEFELEILSYPEFASSQTQIAAAPIRASATPAAARQFIEFLSDPDRGTPVFLKHHFEPPIAQSTSSKAAE